MAFTGGYANDRMPDDCIFQVGKPSVVSNSNTVFEYPIGPGKLVFLGFKLHHNTDVLVCHLPKCQFGINHSPNILCRIFMSFQTIDLADGLRSK